MNERDREFLSGICDEITVQFPSVVAAFEGFSKPYLGGERDGFLVTELFNVSDEDAEAVLSFAEARATDYLRRGGGFVTFSWWTPVETKLHFQEDLAQLLSGRGRRPAHARMTKTRVPCVAPSEILIRPSPSCWKSDAALSSGLQWLEADNGHPDVAVFAPEGGAHGEPRYSKAA